MATSICFFSKSLKRRTCGIAAMSYFVLLSRRILIGNVFFEFFDFLNFASYFVVDSLEDYWLYRDHLVLTQKSTLETLSGATGVFRFKFFTGYTSSCISNPNFFTCSSAKLLFSGLLVGLQASNVQFKIAGTDGMRCLNVYCEIF